ncbi:MAG: MerR family DNA-binding transcriptional regulator [Gammaproteobacteria bacterium]|nr:MerR family DNA-binding transcriptional regulator [Gammaproteobacteria bacterium]MCY4217735.1 MerR family DNA-binding transcriptional regulator [Gammaproteobacteria bacterium]MCY4276034.1 MerR family DNA-binding transcriptional regulator [Gammaproteobacteria bacterium]
MPSTTTYTISDLAKHFDLTTRAIRFYESEGLLLPRREKNRRIYGEKDYIRLKLILRGKRLGFTLSEIKMTMDLYDTQPNEVPQLRYVLEVIENHRKALEQKQHDIENTLADMDEMTKKINLELNHLLKLT